MSHQSAIASVPTVNAGTKRAPEKLSELLERLARESGERISMREIANALDDRSFGAFLLVFALPNLIPLPPGATMVLGLPMVFVAWQMVIGYQKVWLPRALADYTMERATFLRMVARVSPWLRSAETWVRPRNWPLDGAIRERLFGIFALILAVTCVLPIPFGNWLPAFAVAILGVAHTERDGNCLALGCLFGIISIAIATLVVTATGALLSRLF
ncbi:exopolysaccharide biosynthesis protein [Hoeflea sp. YIM 152468]|uniref:exopolysaccharide biosynthesis protein n=1 Tax=Hoeflea sp. YIM 152468 TaxID=3031759 RepID=UPI0023DA6911|nr:exopolysaccharide biosynthesis protein [Hoeflea sp. YIM 152468]MDF1607604.1 exopolysaccharide biosynthesis protein [Hoeflea sp. YIM 152468]